MNNLKQYKMAVKGELLHELLDEIKAEGYTTAYEVNGAILNRLDELKGEPMTDDKYEQEARDTNNTTSEFF